MNNPIIVFILSTLLSTEAFIPAAHSITKTFVPVRAKQSSSSPSSSFTLSKTRLYETFEDTDTIVSPFDDDSQSSAAPIIDGDEPLELTWENVDMVLEEMRPYLIQDGGNVKIADIDGPVVRLQLEGACGTCPSSTQTMKMGLERKLRERIPEIQEVVQAMPEGPALTMDEINVVLDGVRPFLSVAGGAIECESIEGEGSIQPSINLKMTGSSASLNSVKLEISQRLQRHFMMAGLKVEWL
mmetsp:Transcript_6871/g.7812  ORF Transcript_6871/g.7812 Transcript_6871/m.7812 type:complete len:241 (-) Transcript_6871:243-965(-)